MILPKEEAEAHAAREYARSREQQEKDKAARAVAEAAAQATRKRKGRPRKIGARRYSGGQRSGPKQHINWWHPPLITPILEAVARNGSFAAAVRELQQRYPTIYGQRLKANTVRSWFVHPSYVELTASARRMRRLMGKWERPAGSGRKSILTGHDDVKNSILTALKPLRESGVGVTPGAARTVIMAVLQEKLPELQVGTKFLCSYSWVMSFVYRELRWVVR